MGNHRRFCGGAAYNLRTPLFAASLLFLAGVLCAQCSEAAPEALRVAFQGGNRKISAILPQGWRIENLDAFGKLDPSVGSCLALTSSSGAIVIEFKSAALLSGMGNDSRKPRWLAERFAATWKLPLSRWSSLAGITVHDTYRVGKHRTLYIASGNSAGFEFLGYAHVSSHQTVDQIRKLIAELLASAEFVADKPAPVLIGLKPTVSVKPITSTINPHVIWVYGRQLTLPLGWATYDMFSPFDSPDYSRQMPNHLDLAYIGPDPKTPENRFINLNVLWLGPLQTKATRQKITEAWRHRILLWSTAKFKAGHTTEDLAGPKDKSIVYKKSTQHRFIKNSVNPKESVPVHWIYLSDTSQILAWSYLHSADPQEGKLVQDAFEVIRKQLIKQ